MTVYFLQRGPTNGPIKIGFSRDVISRIRTLRFQVRDRLWLLGVAAGNAKQEKVFHRRFADLRLSGEWFKPEGTLIEFIKSLPCPSTFKDHGRGLAYRLHAAFN